MKHNNTVFYIFNIISLFAFLIAISFSLNTSDYSSQLAEFLRHEDSRDIDKILNSYSFPVKNYWDQENLQKSDLEKLYKKAWNNVEYSKNYLVEVEKLSDFNFVLTTQFIYKLKKKSNESTVRSKLNFKLNNDGKIVSIENIELLKSSSSINVENTKSETSGSQMITAFARTHRYALAIFFIVIILNVYWYISYRRFEKERKQLELIEKEEKEKLRQLKLKEEEEKQRRWLIKTTQIDTINDEKDEEIIKLIDRLKSLNSGEDNNDISYRTKQLVVLIKEKYSVNIQKEREEREERSRRVTREKQERIEKERLAKIDKERLAKIEEEHKKEKTRLLKIQREKEQEKLKKTRKEKEEREKRKKEDKEKLLKLKVRHEEDKKRVLKQQRKEKEGLEETKGELNEKLNSVDLSQYLGKIDEDILNDEKSKRNNDDDLRRYMTDFDS